jgi:hypothetical protein
VGEIEQTVQEVAEAGTWEERVQAVRRIPERHGRKDQPRVYAAVAGQLYRPYLSAAFAFVPQSAEYELETFSRTYRMAFEGTRGFTAVGIDELAAVLEAHPETLLVFRMIVGYTPNELAVATREPMHGQEAEGGLSTSRIKGIERSGRIPGGAARLLAATIDRLVTGALWGEAPHGLRTKLDKIDTARGWASVQEAGAAGVPYDAFLHQRHMGGAFRQLLDATSERRGEMLEEAVELLLAEHGIPHVRTGSSDQGEIAVRFNLTVRPAPDFVIFEPPRSPKALLECKLTNDGGTARDKASRFSLLREEAMRLGGIPVVAVVDGLGWERLNDALGPVVRDCDGRVFTLRTLPEMLEVEPLVGLKR